MPGKERDSYFDQLRGIAIIAIVAIHISSVISNKVFAGTSNYMFLFIYRQLLNFAVPLFLFVSGYFLAQKDVSTFKKYESFLVKQANKILIPYVIYTFIFVLIKYYDGGIITIKSIAVNLLTGNIIYPYYFIILIFQYYLLLPLFQKMNNHKGLLLSVAINLLYFIGLYTYRFSLSTDIPNLYYALIFPAWIIFYQYGLYCGKFGLPKKSITLFFLLAISVVLIFVESAIWISEKHITSFAISQLRVSSFIYSLCLINVLVAFRFFNSEILTKIGLVAFGIFLTHIFLSLYIMIFFSDINFVYKIQPLYQVLVLLLILIINYSVIYALQKILPKRINQMLGFS